MPIKQMFQKSNFSVVIWSVQCIKNNTLEQFLQIYIIRDCIHINTIKLLPYGTTISIVIRRGKLNGPLKLSIIICIWGWIIWWIIHASHTCIWTNWTSCLIQNKQLRVIPPPWMIYRSISFTNSAPLSWYPMINPPPQTKYHHVHNVHHYPLYGFCIFRILSSLISWSHFYSHHLPILLHLLPLILHHHCLHHRLLLQPNTP